MIHSIKERSNVSWFVLNNVLIVWNDNETIEFMFAHFNPRLTALAKMSLSRAQNIFMPKNINSITIIITLEGIEEIITEKMTTKHSEEYFIPQRCKKTSTYFEMASRFWLAA